MTSMERQLNEYSSREEQTNKLASESRLKMEEALTIREQVSHCHPRSRSSHLVSYVYVISVMSVKNKVVVRSND